MLFDLSFPMLFQADLYCFHAGLDNRKCSCLFDMVFLMKSMFLGKLVTIDTLSKTKHMMATSNAFHMFFRHMKGATRYPNHDYKPSFQLSWSK